MVSGRGICAPIGLRLEVGDFLLWRRGFQHPGDLTSRKDPWKLALPTGLAPAIFPQTTGGFSIQLREHSKMVGSAGNAPVRRFRQYLTTPDLQSGNRITSLKELMVGS